MSKWPGTWRVICDVCGFEFASDKVRKRWDGLIVCNEDWETRHPQTLYRYHNHTSTPDFVRPEPPDTFIHLCTLTGGAGYADMGEADCAVADYSAIPYQTLVELSTNGHE